MKEGSKKEDDAQTSPVVDKVDTVAEENPPVDTANSVPAETTISSVSDLTNAHIGAMDDFDPAKHATNEDGTPKMKAGGGYAKKRGRKAGNVASALPPKNAPRKGVASINSSDSTDEKISSEEMARQSANMLINAGVMALGDEWEPKDKAEAEGLKMSFKNYYDVAGVPNIPPWFGLVMGIGSYALTRIRQPTTKERLGGFVLRVKSLFGR